MAMDSNGLSDPYVVLKVFPENKENCIKYKTKVQSKTLFPLFDEKFVMQVNLIQCCDSHYQIYRLFF